jgi:PII-like signaling protein
MHIKGEAKLLRIFVGENDKAGNIPVYEKIVLAARENELAGATVFKGIMGYGGKSRIHTAKILRLSEDLPLTIAIVDEIFESSKSGGLITIEKAEIIKYTAD